MMRVARRRVVGSGEAEDGGREEGAVVERLVVVVEDDVVDVVGFVDVEGEPPGKDGCGGVSWGIGLVIGDGWVGIEPEMVWLRATTS